MAVYKGNDTITSETGVVGGEDFRITPEEVSFQANPTDKKGKILFKPADNAAFYDFKMVFNYQEKHGSTVTNKQVRWNFGSKSVDELPYENGCYYITYGKNSLFSLLEEAIGGDTIGVTRYFDNKPVEIMIAAGGEELYNYIQVNSQAGGLSQSVPDYTNVKGGYGVFSSRINTAKTVGLGGTTAASLYGKPWGFTQQ